MIRRIQIKNFKSLADVTVDLGPFTVLIGKNGAGKSAFLQALSVLSWLVRYRSINEVFERENVDFNEMLFRKGRTREISWICEVDLGQKSKTAAPLLKYEVSIGKRHHVYVKNELAMRKEGFPDWRSLPPGEPFIARASRYLALAQEGSETLRYEGAVIGHSILQVVSEQTSMFTVRFPLLAALAEQLGGFRHFQIYGPEPLRLTSKGTAQHLSERGANLPSVVAGIKGQGAECYEALIQEMRVAFPWLKEIEVRSLPGVLSNSLNFVERPSETQKRLRYSPAQVSDGFLRLLALTALKYQSGRVSLLGYEEPENGLHPQALEDCVLRLRDIAKSGTQVIVTTHSPYLLDYLMEAEDESLQPKLCVVVRRGDEPTEILPVPPERLAEARAQGIRAGELWTLLVDELELAGGSRIGQ